MEGHLSTCEACSHALEDLTRVVGQAGALPDLEPPDHLWTGISAAIGEARQGGVLPFPAPRPVGGSRRGLEALTWPRLAAAAVVLVTLTASVSLWVGSTRAASPALSRPGASPLIMSAADAPPPESMAEELATLEGILESARTVLDPNTVRVIEASMGVIEQAIADSRDALEQDPGNAFLAEHLERMYRRKLVYLQDAVRLVEFGG